MTWRRLRVLIDHLPDGSATHRSVAGPDLNDGWTVTDYLLAIIADYSAISVWQRTHDGAKNRNRPKPIPRPGMPDRNDEFLAAAKAQQDRLGR